MMSLKEMHKKLENLKKMSTLHKLIKNYLHLQTFSQCLEEFPDLLADDLLQKYLRFSLESIPDELKVRINIYK